MVVHVVIFNWRDGVTADQAAGFRDALEVLAGEVAALGTIRHGADLAYREGNGDYALVATFSDRAAWDAYQTDPRHKAFLADFVTPLVASRVAIQFEDN
ncbi:Dabb family protein [Sphingomonas sp. MG17]|uniref:Dabb family protein n=1 Tax=Sphingomonas tagetis TaxID=2949092 RepID=A0A9X2HMD2_9SPHN|nr:Dabb family protein [Sphingomonas tagetis]